MDGWSRLLLPGAAARTDLANPTAGERTDMRRSTGRLLSALVAGTVLGVLAACGTATGSTSTPSSAGVATGGGTSVTADTATAEEPLDPKALVIYNAQHEELTQALADAFSAANAGITVQLRNGSDLEMANQLVAEGADSPADVFITENSPGMDLVEGAGLFSDIVPTTLSQVPAQYSPSTGKWVGVAARSTVFVYNKAKLSEDQLPTSLLDLAQPQWKGRWAASPSGADFQAIVSAMYQLKGADTTRKWLNGMQANFTAYKGNTTVMKAVNAGEIAGGVIYHYYWYGDQAKTKENSDNTALHYFGNQDPGAFVSVSGAGVLASSKKQQLAQKFVAFVASKAGQSIIGKTVLEYPLLNSAANPALKPLSSLDAPVVDPGKLNSAAVSDLMTEVGLL
jgi:iron(III) transport system substrate-binding protein